MNNEIEVEDDVKNWKWLGLAMALFVWGCSGDGSSTTGDGGAAGNCWYCTGSGGAGGASGSSSSSGKGGSGGKQVGAYELSFSGEIDTMTGQGSYHYVAKESGTTTCEVMYPVTGATTQSTCAQCTFAYALPLGEATVNTGLAGCDKMQAGMSTYWGHADPGTLYASKDGVTWTNSSKGGTSQVMGTTWSFGMTYLF